MRRIKALIFDFDGLILDTELPMLRAWQEVYRAYGHELPFEKYAMTIGTDAKAFNPLAHLSKLIGESFTASEAAKKHHQLFNRYICESDLMPGVREYLSYARNSGLKTAIASSSNIDWVMGHLERLHCAQLFDSIITAGSSYPAKPDPAVYLASIEKLGISAKDGIAFEDSVNGVRAARTAGLFCVAVPNSVTVNMDFFESDLQVPSLLTVSLQELIKIIETQ